MKKEQWLAASGVIEGMTPDQCKSKWGDYKMKFRQWKELEQQSGFGWNEERGLYEAENDVWAGLNKSWRNIVWHKTHVMPYREQIATVLGSSQATGARAVSAINAVSESVEPLENGASAQGQKRRASSPEAGTPAKKAKAPTAAEEMAKMTGLIQMALQQSQGEPRLRSERAVSLVESEYRGRMSRRDMMKVYNLFENESMAGIFLALEDAAGRDAWMRYTAKVFFWSGSEAEGGGQEASPVSVESGGSRNVDEVDNDEGVVDLLI